jgi:PUA domain protein
LRVYNLSKSARDEAISRISQLNPSIKIRVKELKIAELDDQELAIIFESESKLYVGRNKANVYFPLLKDEVVLQTMPYALVDMGAVKFLINGANVMRPGIVSFSGDFKKGQIIVVREQSHQKAIAVGMAIEDRSALDPMKKGPVVHNLHWVGDKLWEAAKSI